MVPALGAQKWLSLNIHHHNSDSYGSSSSSSSSSSSPSRVVLEDLKSKGYKVVVTDIHKSSKSVFDMNWDEQKCVIVFGNERDGISDEVRELADDSFFIPMKGFAESLNLSVSVAVTLSTLEQRNALIPDLSEVLL